MKQRGSVLLAVMILAAAASMIATLTIRSVGGAGEELRDRRAVLCARYAAIGGAVLGTVADGKPHLISPSVTALSVTMRKDAAGTCSLVSVARCGRAERRFTRRIDDTPTCN